MPALRFQGLCVITLGLTIGALETSCKQRETAADPMTGGTVGEQRFLEIAHGVTIEFRWVPAGKFIMGSPPDEVGRSEDEKQSPVWIKHGFWIAAHETTIGTWRSVLCTTSFTTGNLSQFPVTGVSWNDCREFLKKLKSPAKGWRYELPTEAQWEYACRAGSSSPYESSPTQSGWILPNARGHAHPVGTKSPNAWSIHDMHGNVAEWCRDAVGQDRRDYAIRGGSWDSDLTSRAAARNSDSPFLRINRVGFRLVLINETSLNSQIDSST